MTDRPMGRLEFAFPREAWGGEAAAFTPLLAQPDMLEYLAGATGVGSLTLVAVEHPTAGNRYVDVLAGDADGRRVVIENQYGVGNHDHLTRALAYAVGTDARALIVVAEEHRDEFISVADYLNEVGGLSEEGILVWLVRVRAVRRIGDTIRSPEFVVQAEPNQWETNVRRSTTPALASLDEFYERCVDAGWAETARMIITSCLDQGMTEAHTASQAVSLYYPIPERAGRGPNVIQVWTNSDLWICRGRLHDAACTPITTSIASTRPFGDISRLRVGASGATTSSFDDQMLRR